MKLTEIAEGWYNAILDKFDLASPTVKWEAERRLKICMPCDVRTDGVCDKKKGGCGCPLKEKAFSMSSSCDKWQSTVTVK